jgi:hypothetical protein
LLLNPDRCPLAVPAEAIQRNDVNRTVRFGEEIA